MKDKRKLWFTDLVNFRERTPLIFHFVPLAIGFCMVMASNFATDLTEIALALSGTILAVLNLIWLKVVL